MFKRVLFLIIALGFCTNSAPAKAESCSDVQRVYAKDEFLVAFIRLLYFNSSGAHFENAVQATTEVEGLYKAALACGADLSLVERKEITRQEQAAFVAYAVRKINDLARYTVDPSVGNAADYLVATAKEAVAAAQSRNAEIGPLLAQIAVLERKAYQVDAERRAAEARQFAARHGTTITALTVGIEDPRRGINKMMEVPVKKPAPQESKVGPSQQALLPNAGNNDSSNN